MELQVITPRGVALRTEVERVTVPGTAGLFTILHNHAPIVSTLVPGTITYFGAEGEKQIEIKESLVQVAANVIKIIGR